MRDAVRITGRVQLTLNYGLNKVRFPAPVPSGARVRGRFVLQRVDPVEGGLQVVWNAAVEREGESKPCLVAEWVVRYSL